jgi:aminopeptidase-like protein
MHDDGSTLHAWLSDLFPLSRSVVGPGIDQSLVYIQKLLKVPSKILTYGSGTTRNGWTVPNAWKLITARIEDMAGNTVVTTDDSNLHLWSHSAPFEGVISRAELENHLLTLESVPNAIPYATTYYKYNWGFSVDLKTYNDLTDDEYRVIIQTELYPDTLKILEVVIPGESTSEVLFSTYLCHPSMANNELSGPVLATALIRFLSKRVNKYTYRFLIGPETIGPICYLSDHSDLLKENVFAAFNLTCVGAGDEWSLLHSPSSNTYSDKIALHLLTVMDKDFKTYDFLERGSDERQFCSPNIDLPMVSIMRSKYHEFVEYHNSLDNREFVTPLRLQQSLDFYFSLLECLDADGTLHSKCLGEPFLTNFFNYPSIGARIDFNSKEDYRLASQLVAFANGATLIEVAERIRCSVMALVPLLNKCLEYGLIERKPIKPVARLFRMIETKND